LFDYIQDDASRLSSIEEPYADDGLQFVHIHTYYYLYPAVMIRLVLARQRRVIDRF